MEFRLLGPLEVEAGGNAVALGGPRERAVLAALLLRANRFASVGYLVDAVWDRSPASPETNLRTYVAGLRRRLGPLADGSARIITKDGGYLLLAGRDELDVAGFEDLVDGGERALAEDDPRAAAELLGAALGRWRGEPLAGCRLGPGLRADLDRLRERRLRATEQLAAARIQLGQHEEAVADLRRLTTEHPHREELWAQLMIGLCRAGRRADALDVYTAARRRLVDDLGVEPGTRLRRLHADVLQDDQELGPRMAAEPAVRPAQLPADLPTFTGRDGELERLLAPLRDDSVLISSIDGMAGIGKTALAVHVAHRLADRYPDGQLFVDLHGHTLGVEPTEPAKALDQLLRALGVPGEAVPHDVDAAAALYRSRIAGRRVLVVLDNAAGEDQILPLLPGTPGCLVLITSRRRLTGLDHAVPLTLDVLPVPDAITLFTGVTGQPADAELVPDIVRLCGQLPLAIRIAAARLQARPSWTLAHLADRLRDHRRRLGELSAGQRGVAAAINLSYDQLEADQQRVFRLLGLHPGTDIDAAATAALTGRTAGDAEQILETLLDAHLLHQHRADRYQFHDLIRAHATQTCVATEPEPARRAALTRLLDHYADITTVAIDLLYPDETGHRPRRPDPPQDAFASESHASAWLSVELANLLDVAAYAAAEGWPAHAVHLSVTLFRYLETRAHLFGAERLYPDAIAAARKLGDRRGEVAALTAAGKVHRLRGRHGPATECLEAARTLAHDAGDRTGELDALRSLGDVHHMRGQFPLAEDYYRLALPIARDIDDQLTEADVLRGIGQILRLHGQYDDAADHYHQALCIAVAHGDTCREVYVLHGLGNVHYARGQFDQAADYYERSQRLAPSTDDRLAQLYALIGLGEIHRAQGRLEIAVDWYQRVLDLSQSLGNTNYQYEALLGLGHTYFSMGDAELALRHHQEALDLANALDQLSDQARALDGVARAQHALGRHEAARTNWRRALAVLDELGLTEIEEVNADVVRAHLAAMPVS